MERSFSSWTVEMGPDAITGVFIRESRERFYTHKHTHTEVPYEDRGRDWNNVATVKKCPVTRGWKRQGSVFSFRISTGTVALPTS